MPSWPLLRRRPVLSLLAVVALACPSRIRAETAVPGAADLEFFESKVRPLLVAHCSECHSRKSGDPEGNLSFDSRADFLAAEGVAIPGRPEASLIVEAVGYEGELQMPPDGRLPAESVAVFVEWVRRGLPWPEDGAGTAAPAAAFDLAARKAEHWCWQPPRAAAPPAVKRADWCRDDIDRFVLARLEAAGLEPAHEASRAALVRRASEILTGLPADPADVERVAAEQDPKAFEHYVDGLLASPHYGERFARHWLDVVRYGETRGHEFDVPIPNAWRYRDWVVKAFNDDLPYDQFVREQIAGDLLERPRVDAGGANESAVGTGFWFLGEEIHSPVDIAQDDADRIDNKVDTFGKAFLGLALGCARCHDHKFDAISNEDYYAIAGMIMSSSYRQVPFESLETNRNVARQVDAADTGLRGDVLPLLADVLAGREGELAAVLPPAAEVAATAAQRDALETRTAREVVIADYTRAVDPTPLISDGFAWGLRPQPAGAPLGEPAAGDRPARVRLRDGAAARSDAIWSRTKSHGTRDEGHLGQSDRAGRVLRTPKVRLTQGVLWHRVRGDLQIFACVDSHILVHGPLYGQTIMDVNTNGQWRWIRQDLTRDAKWEGGHVIHVEYVSRGGEAEVAEVVAAADEPRRADPLLTALAGRDGDSGAEGRELFAEALAACRDGSLPGRPDAAALATLVNRVLAAPGTDWSTPAATRLAAETARLTAARDTLLGGARLDSAVAPAILDGNGVDQFVLLKGSAARPGELSPRRFLEAIDGPRQPLWPAGSSGRMQLADRVLDPGNPLTARVLVNRVWHHLFGRGLVPTTDNFGKLGEAAADPGAAALLDALAVRFRDEGFGVKRLIREIVTSSTWRMSSVRDPRAVAVDPLNTLLHHYPLRRLEGEAIRDKILAVSGRLDRTVGGPGVEVHLADFHEGRGKPGSGPLDGKGRRSIYTTIRRNFLPALPLAFDMPVPFQAMGRRNVTNVPAQALTLMNDPFVLEQAAVWARATLADGSAAPEARIDGMYRRAFARPPSADELAATLEFLAAQARQHGVDFAAQPRHEAAWADLAHALFNAKEFIFVP